MDLLMGLDMELDLEKSYSSDPSPNTVLPCRHFSDVEKKRANSKIRCKDDLLTVKDGFTEISICRYRSSSGKTPSRPVGLQGNVELKRGSIYQNSTEVRTMKKMEVNEGRRKIELSRDSDTNFSFSIVDSLCCSYEENTHKSSPALSVDSNPTSVRKSSLEPRLSDDYIEICPKLDNREKQSAGTVRSDSIENPTFRSDNREKQSAGTVRSDSIENPTFRSEQVVGPVNDANDLLEDDMALTFHRSLSAKNVEMPHSPSPSESTCSSGAGSKSRFNPIKKMFDPFMKSKSLRSPLGYIAELGDVKTTGISNVRRNQTMRKSLLPDFANTVGKSNVDSLLVRNDHHQSTLACSPVHLHGCLKLESKHGIPHFEFSLDCPEEIFVAKTWKANNAVNWVYTFHSICSRKKSNASGWNLTDSNKESLVGQMQVSCYLCSELKDGRSFDNSKVTEFVLYDIAHARQSVSSQDSFDIGKPLNYSKSGSGGGTHELDLNHQTKHASHASNFGSSNPYPLPAAVLHSDLEIAAIVIQLPVAKKESLKYKRRNKSSDTVHSNVLNNSTFEQRRKNVTDRESPDKLNVVIPAGNHSLPIDESWGSSSLLDRWRMDGRCDCGGWDMGCPLTVFGSPGTRCAEDERFIDNQRPLELFVQGRKQKIPELTMRVVEEGKYAVDFHAQLSALQAFSICVAVLHSTEASNDTGEERSKELPLCNSLKVLIEEEMQFFTEPAKEEEKKKVSKKMEEIQQSYVLNPPFSPIARV